MEIVTNRFLLRDFADSDILEFEKYHIYPRSLEFYGTEEAKPGHARGLIALFQSWAAEQPRLNYQLAIIQRKAPHALIGCGGVRCAGMEPGTAELGIELAPKYWGRYGYAAEILHALIDYGFGTLGLQTIHGLIVSANSRVARLVSAFGATAATLPTPAWMSAKGWTQVEWTVTRQQWESGCLTLRSRGTRQKAARPSI
ncbi:GNAT family N-acetyltransferase [Thiomicrorhabdus cannonii]|uniref:GNAT family N-acetyltransferase n=1 Tax=Thiomicrorhabdus cannonii TaxID=2748011 RepID=UPI0015BD7682|nr:GNAT family N-acetyltransferase [Thiomicrorhabdus cannonii]